MFQRKTRRFRRRPNNRNRNGSVQHRLRPNSFSNGHLRNNFKNSMSAEKLFEKYSSLAKEAMSTGDKTMSENYLQHADHFMRMIEDKNRNRDQNKSGAINKHPDGDQKMIADSDINLETEIKSKE